MPAPATQDGNAAKEPAPKSKRPIRNAHRAIRSRQLVAAVDHYLTEVS
jgi:hypothetical protein